MDWCCGGARAKDVDPLVPPGVPAGLDQRQTLQAFAGVLSAEYEFGWEAAVEEWIDAQGAGWIYSKHVPADQQSRSDRFWAWCVYTVQPKVKSRRVTVAK